MRWGLAPLALALLVPAAAGCGGSGAAASSRTGGSVTVFAAASLVDAFSAEASAYRAATGRSVTVSYAGSQQLVAQVQQGAPADVVATADTSTMGRIRSLVLGRPQTFARNRLVIVVAPGNPRHIRTLADLARPGTVVVLAAASVPAGHYALSALSAAQVTVHPKSLEDNVRGVLTKVETGEADAGLVYVTDAESAGSRVTEVAVPDSPLASYPIAALDERGRGFVSFVLSDRGQAILHRYGFLPP